MLSTSKLSVLQFFVCLKVVCLCTIIVVVINFRFLGTQLLLCTFLRRLDSEEHKKWRSCVTFPKNSNKCDQYSLPESIVSLTRHQIDSGSIHIAVTISTARIAGKMLAFVSQSMPCRLLRNLWQMLPPRRGLFGGDGTFVNARDQQQQMIEQLPKLIFFCFKRSIGKSGIWR